MILTGVAGEGKSTLAAALARPEITDGRVRPDFAHSVALLGGTTNLRNLAVDLEEQLRRSVAEFARAVDEFHRSLPRAERDKLDFLTQMVLRPLDHLPDRTGVRVVLDGLDQLSDGTRRELRRILEASPDHMRLVITTRDNTPHCPDGHVIRARCADPAVLSAYLADRRVPEDARAAILDRAQSHWLITQLLADAVLEQSGLDLARLPGTVNEAYAFRLDQAGAADEWPTRFSPVLGPLAVAGAGPVLPLGLLTHASAALGGPSNDSAVLEVLGALRGLVVRRDSGTQDELAGLFHTTLAEYILSPEAASAGFSIHKERAHRAIARAIEELAPASDHKEQDSLHRYAFLREADHWSALNDFERVLICLKSRTSILPRENLEQWRRWHSIIEYRCGVNDRKTFEASHSIQHWTGETGDSAEAKRLAEELLEKAKLRRDDPLTFVTRHDLARWTGELGEGPKALQLFTELLPDVDRVRGRYARITLSTRHNIARWTGELGDPSEALRQFEELLRDREQYVGQHSDDALEDAQPNRSLDRRSGRPIGGAEVGS